MPIITNPRPENKPPPLKPINLYLDLALKDIICPDNKLPIEELLYFDVVRV